MYDLNQTYCVYIVASIQRTLYIGVTRNLEVRVAQHRSGTYARSFSTRYRCCRLVYYEIFLDIRDAIEREKVLKAYRRAKKVALIESLNPEWADLSVEPWKARVMDR